MLILEVVVVVVKQSDIISISMICSMILRLMPFYAAHCIFKSISVDFLNQCIHFKMQGTEKNACIMWQLGSLIFKDEIKVGERNKELAVSLQPILC